MDLLHSRPNTGTREGSDVIKSIKYQVLSLKYQLEQFVLMSLIQKCNICRPMLGKIWVFTSLGMIRLPWRRVWLLSSGYHCQVHVIFFPDFEENWPKRMCSTQSQYCPEPHNHCHFRCKIKSKTLLETWIYCILDPIQGPEKGLM